MNKIIEQDLNEILSTDYVDWSRFKDKNVLVTGANGMLPAYMVFTLLHLNKTQGTNTHVYALIRNRAKAEAKFQDWLDDENLHIIVQDVSNQIVLGGGVKNKLHNTCGKPSFAKVLWS